MNHSILIELTICTVSFAVALAAIWRLHRAESHIRHLEAENTRLALALDDAGEIRKTARQWQRAAVSWQSECRRLAETMNPEPTEA